MRFGKDPQKRPNSVAAWHRRIPKGSDPSVRQQPSHWTAAGTGVPPAITPSRGEPLSTRLSAERKMAAMRQVPLVT